MDYLKLFQTHEEYEAFVSGGTMMKPNVSHCVQENEVHYNPIPHDYSKDYLTFVALEDGTFTFYDNAVSYSLDNGETWTELAANTDSPTVTAGNKIMWKGELAPFGQLSSSGRFNVQGNIMSLLYGDEFEGQTDLIGKNNMFQSFFADCDVLISAENLILPATTLAQSCYYGMFQGCTSLINAPELPATTLASNCYSYMFNGCTSLTTAPEISATTLAEYCCVNMFSYCTSLTTAPSILPATALARECYYSMFEGCRSLTTAPELPATTLVRDCYVRMFNDCSSLNYIKCLATNISESDYGYTLDWLSGVAASGTFVKNSTETWDTTDICDNCGIPEGWTVQDAS